MNNIESFFSGIAFIFLFSGFIKCLTVLGVLRCGLGLNGLAASLVSIALAFVLAVVLLSPRLSVNEEQSLLLGKANSQSAEEIFNRHKNFIVKNSDQVLINRFSELQNNLANKQEGESKAINSNTKTDANNEKPSVLILAFIVTELQEAFSIAAIILLPLLVIDLVIVNIFQLLAIRDYEPVMVALPLKLIIFYMVDGWGLISEKLINGYI